MRDKQSKIPPKKKIKCEITDRDYRLLRFLWRWKAVSTVALAKKFFADAQLLTAYRRLIRLESGGYIQSREVNGRWNEVWVLAERGFKHIIDKLGDLKQDGHKSENVHHDYLATAFHLGEWMTSQPDKTENYSEQQLRRISADAWPDWVPTSEGHRPDGYSAYLSDGNTVVVAFETELCIKSRRRYESVVAFYDSEEKIQSVFWLVDSRVTLNALKKSFEKYHMRYPDKHHFVLLSDFKVKGWMAPFIEGRYSGKTIQDILCPKPHSRPTLHPLCSDTLSLLDSRKKPINSNATPIRKNAQKS